MKTNRDYLDLLVRAQAELASALGSLAGKRRDGLIDGYVVYCASHINRAADGFISLRRGGREHAARFLVRTTIEAMIKMLAVENRNEIAYRVARNDFLEDEKWARSCGAKKGSEVLCALEKRWRDFSETYRLTFPDHRLEDGKMALRDIAATAKLGEYYDALYRLYSQYTHASLRATSDMLHEFFEEDPQAMCFPVVAAIGVVVRHGGSSSIYEALAQEVKEK
jgi:hypothetical protein